MLACVQVDLSHLGRTELTCLFINLYNSLIIHALVVYGAPSAPDRSKFFSSAAKCATHVTLSCHVMGRYTTPAVMGQYTAPASHEAVHCTSSAVWQYNCTTL